MSDTLLGCLYLNRHINNFSGCWVFTGLKNRDGYGRIGVPGKRRIVLAHRAAYELLVGPIPEGLVLDHLCRRPDCFNPGHLEPVTLAENTRRGLHHRFGQLQEGFCRHDHEYTEGNTYITPDGKPRCKQCIRIAGRKHDAKRRPSATTERRAS